MKKRFIYLAAAAAMLAGCSETDELAKNQLSEVAEGGAVSFSIYTNRAVTRAGQAGVINTDSLKKGNGIGVFAYHTNNSRYDERNSLPNFMYNQQVKWNAGVGNGVWEYSPLKYWPNEFGTNAVSEDIDYVSFFAYAPYVAVNPTTGTPEVDYSKFVAKDFAQYLGYDDVADFEVKEGYKTGDGEGALKMLFANQQQGKNITSISRNADKGDPIVRYVVDTNPQTSVDLLWGVAAKDNGFKGLAGPDNVTEGNCYIDLSKQIGTADSIRWNFHHALAKLNVQIIAAADTATQGLTTYVPKNAEDLEKATKIYLRSIDFTGFATRGALNLHSEATAVDYKLKPNWTNYDGTDLTAANVTFYDGLKDGKEGYTDNIAPGEKPQGLNPELIEEPTTTTWADKRQGIPTQAYANLFAGAKSASDAIFVIPTNERMTITVVYDIMTRDTLLSQKLSDGFTKGSRVQNKISQTLKDLKLEAGKAYTIKLVVGIESVKIDVAVEDWDTTEAAKDVDLPYNPGEGTSGGGDTPSWKLTLSSPAKDLYITANGGLIAQHTLDVASTEFTVEMPELTSQTVNIVATDGSGNCWYCTQENMSFAIGQTYQSSPTMTALGTESSSDVYKMTGAGTIPANKTVVLSGVTISNGQIACSGNATIILMGTNSVTGASNQAAIKIGGSGTTLTITGSGSLTATGGMYGAGIGTDYNGSGGNIVINGGTVTAQGGTGAAGIGTGIAAWSMSSSSASNGCGAITIGTGVTKVTATKGSNAPNSIGKGNAGWGASQACGTITIGGDATTYAAGVTESPFTYPTAP